MIKKVFSVALGVIILGAGYSFLKGFNPIDRIINKNFSINGYPHILKPLSESEIFIIQSEFNTLNPKTCTVINKYGFTGDESCSLSFLIDGVVREEIRYSDKELVKIAEDFLVKNSKFTGVQKKEQIILHDIIKNTGCVKCDGSILDQKNIDTMLIFKTNSMITADDIKVLVNNHGVVLVRGNKIPDIQLPLEIRVSESSAKKKVIGKTLEYKDIGGQKQKYKITAGDIQNVPANKIVYMKETEKGLEFYTVWEIKIGNNSDWTVYIDTITGKQVDVSQNFQT